MKMTKTRAKLETKTNKIKTTTIITDTTRTTTGMGEVQEMIHCLKFCVRILKVKSQASG